MRMTKVSNKFPKMGETAFAQAGEGPTIVLVHGLGLNLDMWQWQLPAFKNGYRVVTYDLLGHGYSAKPSGPYYMSQMVDQLRQLIDDLGVERCALIGFSLGGLIVQAFTLAHPDRVWALAILNAAHGRTPEQRASIMERVEQCRLSGPGATVSDALSRWFSTRFAEQNANVLEKVRQWVLANDPAIYPELYKLLASADIGLEYSIAAIKCPTLVLTGEEDTGNSPEMAQRIASNIPGAQLKVLEGLRHMALVEDPDQVNHLLTSFLGEALNSKFDSVDNSLV
ncbi:MAG: pimeloyl-ACP methyl ester carboxylesterase [Gammaproteobacteria bacterium]|jgi:pimeloyl-ACP methyl ester carboxylesterase